MRLSAHQNETLTNLLESDETIVALTGEGGVGKSHTISEFISSQDPTTVAVTGTTHRAVANLKEMSGRDGRTIHSFLGLRMVYKGKDTYLQQVPNFEPDMGISYLIIDEMSMMTRDVMRHLKTYIEHSNCLKKVIMIGDPIQLTLPNSIDCSKIPSFELTQQMRQKDTPNVTNALQAIREAIETGTELDTVFSEGEDLKVYHDHYDFMKEYRQTKTDKMFLCYQNSTVSTYNKNVKKYLHRDEIFSEGDYIYPTSPIILEGDMLVTNREIVQIASVHEEDNHYEINTTKGVKIMVAKTKSVLKEYLDSLAEQKKWKEYYKIKESFAEVHHLFAGTSHSAQGMSIDEVFIDFTELQKILDMGKLSDLYRILYVAISRCKFKAHIFVGNERVYKALGDYTRRNKC